MTSDTSRTTRRWRSVGASSPEEAIAGVTGVVGPGAVPVEMAATTATSATTRAARSHDAEGKLGEPLMGC